MPSSGDIAGLLIVAMAIAFTGWATIRLASTRIDAMNERGSEGTLARFNGRPSAWCRSRRAGRARRGQGWPPLQLRPVGVQFASY
jgi:hypothetical protein